MLSIGQLWELALLVTPLRIYYLFLALAVGAYLIYRLQTKYFYLVRHGRTMMNDAEVKQGAEGALSEAGIRQANALGKALAQVEPRIQHICSSPLERARQTAAIINSYLHVRISYTRLLTERRNPEEVIGKNVDDPDVRHITGLIEKGFHEDDYRFSNEENFVDLSKRARRCMRYLENRFASRICVVTHHAFLHMFLSSVLYGKKLDAVTYAKLAFFNPADNAGVTICAYQPWKRWFSATRGWEILAYNEYVDTH